MIATTRTNRHYKKQQYSDQRQVQRDSLIDSFAHIIDMKLCAHLERLQVEVAAPEERELLSFAKNNNASCTDRKRLLKEWIYAHCKEEIMAATMVQIANSNGNGNSSGGLSSVTIATANKMSSDDTEGHCGRPAVTKREDRHRLALLDKIAQVQRQYLQMEEPRVVFGNLLSGLLELMDSEYGFIGEVKHEEDGTVYLQTHAITNIAWDAATRSFYEDNIEDGLKFYNMNSLFGHVIANETVVIANEPYKDPRRCGIPAGHPPLNKFLGIPFFDGSTMNGMVGIANKPGGYTAEDVEFLEPFVVTCSNLIRAYGAIQQNEYLIGSLETKVAERTRELELANVRLAEAHDQVKKAAADQLEHFASMSHEIRTPLNCIVGLSSLLLEDNDSGNKLNPQQEESVRMMVASGELLVSVVNDVLDYSKLQSGNVQMNVRSTNVQETLQAVVYSIGLKAKERGIAVRTAYDASVPQYVDTDRRRLQQILYNLLGNAVKFSKDGGTVELNVSVVLLPPNKQERQQEQCPASSSGSCSKRESSEAPASDAQDGSGVATEQAEDNVPATRCPFHRSSSSKSTTARCPHHQGTTMIAAETSARCGRKQNNGGAVLQFVVKDYGKGIDRGDFENIFLPFLQASDSHGRRKQNNGGSGQQQQQQQQQQKEEKVYEGTGLGLAITSKLVAGLGGTIDVDSVLGRWTEFTVNLPCSSSGNVNGGASAASVVDFTPLQKSLANVTILHVASAGDAKDPERLDPKNVRPFGVEWINLGSCRELEEFGKRRQQEQQQQVEEEEKKEGNNNDDDDDEAAKCYLALVQEDLYNAASMSRFAECVAPASAVLVTTGHEFSVPEEAAGHVRSITQVIPAVLFQSLASYVRNHQQNEMNNNKKNGNHIKSNRESNRNNCNGGNGSNFAGNVGVEKNGCSRNNSKLVSLSKVNSINQSNKNCGQNKNQKTTLASSASLVSGSSALAVSPMPSSCTPPPCHRRSSGRGPPDSSGAGADDALAKVRILIAEDNVINQKVLHRMLTRLGFGRVDIVGNGLRAVETCRTNDYDLVLMDMCMPVMDGVEACRQIVDEYNHQHREQQQQQLEQQQQQRRRRPKIVFVTANVSRSFEDEALAAGGDGFIAKPFNLQGISSYLRQSLGCL